MYIFCGTWEGNPSLHQVDLHQCLMGQLEMLVETDVYATRWLG